MATALLDNDISQQVSPVDGAKCISAVLCVTSKYNSVLSSDLPLEPVSSRDLWALAIRVAQTAHLLFPNHTKQLNNTESSVLSG